MNRSRRSAYAVLLSERGSNLSAVAILPSAKGALRPSFATLPSEKRNVRSAFNYLRALDGNVRVAKESGRSVTDLWAHFLRFPVDGKEGKADDKEKPADGMQE